MNFSYCKMAMLNYFAQRADVLSYMIARIRILLSKWLCDWFFVSSVVIGVGLIFYFKTQESIRIVCFAYQVFGFCCSYVLLHRTKNLFRCSGLYSWLGGLFSEYFCGIHAKDTGAALNITAPLGDFVAYENDERLSKEIMSGSSPEYRFKRIYEVFIRFWKESNEKYRELHGVLVDEKNERRDSEQEISEKIKDVAVGSVVLAECGLVYFVVATVLSAWTPEIERLIK